MNTKYEFSNRADTVTCFEGQSAICKCPSGGGEERFCDWNKIKRESYLECLYFKSYPPATAVLTVVPSKSQHAHSCPLPVVSWLEFATLLQTSLEAVQESRSKKTCGQQLLRQGAEDEDDYKIWKQTKDGKNTDDQIIKLKELSSLLLSSPLLSLMTWKQTADFLCHKKCLSLWHICWPHVFYSTRGSWAHGEECWIGD